KTIFNSLLVTLSVVLALGATAMGQQRRNFQSQTATTSSRSQGDAITVFRSARDLITDGDWAKAQEKFNEYVSSYPNEKNLDAALYWMAYAEHKLAKYDASRKTISRLLEKYPSSNWRDDARVLLAQIPGVYFAAADQAAAYEQLVNAARAVQVTPAPAQMVDPTIVYSQTTPAAPVVIRRGSEDVLVGTAQGLGIGAGAGQGIGYAPVAIARDEFGGPVSDDDPCEFKIVVLQALFQTDLQRGIMAATDWLKQGSTQTVRCKAAALTLLGRHGGKTVTPVILGVARNETDLKLRARAISTLGTTNDDSVIDALRDFALTSQENNIIEASLYALSKHTGERAIGVLSDIATSGKTISHRKIAISNISTRAGEPAVDALFRIYDSDQNVEIRKAVISGFANRKSERAGNKLVEIARGSDNIELRKAAISSISRRGGDKAVEFLLSLYDSERNEELKDQIVNSLASGTMYVTAEGIGFPAQAGSSSRLNDQRVIDKLIQIARDQQAPMERRKRAIGWLSRSKDPKVLAFLQELLK
ncbi:MAG TPA: HEAT repeat domain-containing protein, partial [Pyrinomonadaceae bacterium]|nr:HEAT repeat domain-containing protein [Pyrinomonadaceae bacterium]